MYQQNIDRDVRAPQDSNPPDEEYLRKFTQKMCQFRTDSPVTLPLFKKLYCTPETDTDLCDDSVESSSNKPETGIMHTKLQQVLSTDPSISPQEALRLLSFDSVIQKGSMSRAPPQSSDNVRNGMYKRQAS